VIILDTNVVSEAMRMPSSSPVAEWLKPRPIASLLITAVTVAEILHGIELLPAGRRRMNLEDQFGRFLSMGFRNRILVFNADAAEAYAKIRAIRHRRGRPITPLDAMIGAIASATGSELATRNMADFEGCGVTVINPWN
jgi:predicted nucleic acid-binding protein